MKLFLFKSPSQWEKRIKIDDTLVNASQKLSYVQSSHTYIINHTFILDFNPHTRVSNISFINIKFYIIFI